MIVAFHRGLRYDAGLLEQVVDDLAALDEKSIVQPYFHPLAEAGGVVCV